MESMPFGLVVRDGALHLRAPGVALDGGRVAVRLLLGAGEETVELAPRGSPSEASGRRWTPLGPERWRSLRWTGSRGLAVTWTVGELTGTPGATLRATFHNCGSEPVRLREVSLCRTPEAGLRCEEEASGWWLSTLAQTSRCGDLATLLPSVMLASSTVMTALAASATAQTVSLSNGLMLEALTTEAEMPSFSSRPAASSARAVMWPSARIATSRPCFITTALPIWNL